MLIVLIDTSFFQSTSSMLPPFVEKEGNIDEVLLRFIKQNKDSGIYNCDLK